ncbi:uncharacterized protein LOC129234555 isoform X2 [Uloborus diversus]|nr:uncharacterized protein LOC129234555 isoform X2 [Uloborus diversus]
MSSFYEEETDALPNNHPKGLADELHNHAPTPEEALEKIASEMKNFILEWKSKFQESRNAEEAALAQLDNTIKKVYNLEAECLKERLYFVNRILEGRK